MSDDRYAGLAERYERMTTENPERVAFSRIDFYGGTTGMGYDVESAERLIAVAVF